MEARVLHSMRDVGEALLGAECDRLYVADFACASGWQLIVTAHFSILKW